jgi:hypothetical protein
VPAEHFVHACAQRARQRTLRRRLHHLVVAGDGDEDRRAFVAQLCELRISEEVLASDGRLGGRRVKGCEAEPLRELGRPAPPPERAHRRARGVPRVREVAVARREDLRQ